jgi:FAD/FMN-containing dehydrogenase
MSQTRAQADLLGRLEARLGRGGLLTGADDLAPYAVDWRRLFPGRPAAVARPTGTAEVAAVMAACHAAGVAVVPQGGHTGLAGGATPDASGGQVVLSLARMNAIRRVRRPSTTVPSASTTSRPRTRLRVMP